MVAQVGEELSVLGQALIEPLTIVGREQLEQIRPTRSRSLDVTHLGKFT